MATITDLPPELQLLIHDLLEPVYRVYWKRTCSAFYAIGALSKCLREDPQENAIEAPFLFKQNAPIYIPPPPAAACVPNL
jgi:hypothetical protein